MQPRSVIGVSCREIKQSWHVQMERSLELFHFYIYLFNLKELFLLRMFYACLICLASIDHPHRKRVGDFQLYKCRYVIRQMAAEMGIKPHVSADFSILSSVQIPFLSVVAA